MAKTGANGIAFCRTILSTSSSDAGKWGDDELYALMNEAQLELAGVMPPRLLGTNLVSSTTHTLAASSTNPYFSRSASNLRTTDLAVQRTSGGLLRPVQKLEDMTALMRQRTKQIYSGASEQSDFYVEQGDKIHLHPTYTTQVWYHLHYVKVPSTISSTVNFSVPDHLYEWVCYRAVVAALIKAGEFESAAKFNELLASKVQSFKETWNAEPPVPFVSVPKKG